MRVGITKAADQPWRYGLAGSPFLSRRDATRADPQARRRGDRPAGHLADDPARGPADDGRLQLQPLEPFATARSTGRPTTVGTTPCRGLASDERHPVVGRERPFRGDLADDDVEPLPARARLVDHVVLERLRRQPVFALVERQADHPRHLDLVRLAVRRALRPLSEKIQTFALRGRDRCRP